MCGIYGAINVGKGSKWSQAIIYGLTWANRDRGVHSCGFFDSSGRMIKRAGDPSNAIAETKVRNWVQNSSDFTWAIGGHTRHATQGAITKRNAHPFRYGDVVGSHNGMVDAPRNFNVDSEYLFDEINKSDYTSLGEIGGYWGLSWFDKRDERFYLTQHNGSLAYTMYDGVCYYSSDADHLKTFLSSDIIELGDGEVIAFQSDGTVLQSLTGDIVGIENNHGKYSYYNADSYGYSNFTKVGSSFKPVDRVKTYYYDQDKTGEASIGEESEWRESWSSYLHSMSDDDFNNWEGECN